MPLELPNIDAISLDSASLAIMDDTHQLARKVNEFRPLSEPTLSELRRRLLTEEVYHSNAIEGVPVYANGLAFSGERLIPSFPYYDAAFPRSANAKARHLAPYRDHTLVFAGDGRSDLDAALASHVVFAKDALARELQARAVAFHSFVTLESMLAFLEAGSPPARN